MGFFLGTDPQTSLTVLGRLPELSRRSACRCWSRCRANPSSRLVRAPGQSGPASLAAEMFAAARGPTISAPMPPAPLRDGAEGLEPP